MRLATEVVAPVVEHFDQHYLDGMRRKAGLHVADEDDTALLQQLLQTMHAGRVDFTLAFRRLSDVVRGADPRRFRDLFPGESAIDDWLIDVSRTPVSGDGRRAGPCRCDGSRESDLHSAQSSRRGGAAGRECA